MAGDAGGSYRFALRPLWILSHVFVLACVLVMFRLGIWQLDRLHERRALNDAVAANTVGPAVPLDEADAMAADGDLADVEYRRMQLDGTYLVDEQVLVRNRSQDSAPGYWVVTPLQVAAEDIVAVNRGWVPIELVERGDAGSYAPPEGTVTVLGYVRKPEERVGLGVEDPPGRLDTLSRVDVARLDEQMEGTLAPFWLQLSAQEPAQPDALPAVVPLPEPTDGPHLNYAGQWFIFGTLTLIVYPLLIRRRARKPAERADRPEVVRDARADRTTPGEQGGRVEESV